MQQSILTLAAAIAGSLAAAIAAGQAGGVARQPEKPAGIVRAEPISAFRSAPPVPCTDPQLRDGLFHASREAAALRIADVDTD